MGLRGEAFIEVPGPGGTPAGTLLLRRGAFGSGEHETTASCLQILAELPGLRGGTMLDLGCGTGILALAGLRLGAARAVCVDVDLQAAALARANAAANGLAARVQSVAGELASLAGSRFGVIAANLPAEVLLGIAGALLERAAPGGWLLLSGVLWEEAFEVRRRLQEFGWGCRRERWLEEYCTLLLQVPPSP